MKIFVITMLGHQYSESSARACQISGQKVGVQVEIFPAVTIQTHQSIMDAHGLSWQWAHNNTRETVCPHTGLVQFPYRARDLRAKIACSLSHYLLWHQCKESGEDYVILEHDARFLTAIPDLDFHGAVQINDPKGGGYRGRWHSKVMRERGLQGVQPLTAKREPGSRIPDGFSGNSAYMIHPWAAREFCDKFHDIGVWPNDATICLQLFPWLQEYYPFVTRVCQTQSTTTQ